MSTILVTGGAGYIGSHICKALSDACFLPVTIDNLIKGNLDSVRWGPMVHADICNERALQTVVAEYKPRAIIHCAAWSDVAESRDRTGEYRHNNVDGTAAVAKAAGDIPVVLSSSAAVYREASGRLTENSELDAPSHYGRTKADAEALLPRAIALRYFNVAGADSDNDLGENKRPATHLITKALESVKVGKPMTVYGDGENVRDFVHVQDVADANVKAMFALLEGAAGQAINVCSGIGYSVLDVINECERVTNTHIRTKRVPARPAEAKSLVGSNDRAFKVLRWKPRRSLENQISTAWEWMTRG